MIPAFNVTAWGNHVPWVDRRQIEQDLIISRALVEIFNHPILSRELRFRGGTALHKLHLPKPLRYSEDIDLVRTSAGSIGEILDAIRGTLEPWLGRARYVPTDTAPKLIFRVPSEADPNVPIKLKVEINTREIASYDPIQALPFSVKNDWFTGQASIPTFTLEEILATKLRALLQREKGRDLFDLDRALASCPSLKVPRVIEMFSNYLAHSSQAISRAAAEERMLAKLSREGFLTDLRPLLPIDEASRLDKAEVERSFTSVWDTFIQNLPGASWASTPDRAAALNMPHLART